jgi:hypothetical protein
MGVVQMISLGFHRLRLFLAGYAFLSCQGAGAVTRQEAANRSMPKPKVWQAFQCSAMLMLNAAALCRLMASSSGARSGGHGPSNPMLLQ